MVHKESGGTVHHLANTIRPSFVRMIASPYLDSDCGMPRDSCSSWVALWPICWASQVTHSTRLREEWTGRGYF